MKKTIIVAIVGLILSPGAIADVETQKNEIKQQIISLAKSFEGQGDPDYSRQNALEPLVQELLNLSPQMSIEDRLPVLAGAWRQVWGPYDYRNEDRGIDPELGIEEIYQVVSLEGYYYNVSYLYKKGDRNQKRVGLLRGEFKLDPFSENILNVRFTRYSGVPEKPNGLELWQLAELAENSKLPNKFTIVPTIIVRLFFGGGKLKEVYTDSDLRILYGASKRSPTKEAIYIMTRVN